MPTDPAVRPTADVRPPIFIGSSREGLPVAERFCQALSAELQPTLWTEGIFEPGTFTLESLEAALQTFPYALIVFSPDDVVQSRGKKKISARDNAIFELGLFVGKHGHSAAFYAVPDTGLNVPTDIWGLEPVRYHVTSHDDYDVTKAAKEILRTLHKRPPRRSSPFWDTLADNIIILYGVEPEPENVTHPRLRVSPRDLNTAWELKSFLDRRYPHKQVWHIPSTETGWERLTEGVADLIVVGGFVTNAEFAKHRAQYEDFFRLKLGRLCIVEGQRVHHPKFAMPAGCLPPDHSDPQSIEDFPSDFTERDFGMIFNGILHVYGRERRVIVVAGVKGHGTRGAAKFLCDPAGIDKYLQAPLTGSDTVEIAVAADVTRDVVHHVEPVSIRMNGNSILEQKKYSSACELGRPCDGCDFGLRQVVPRHLRLSARLLSARIKAIVFDLDDTLIDTFGALIMPLEVAAAKAMVDAGIKMNPTTLASHLLRIRRQAPSNVEEELRKIGCRLTPKAARVRTKLLTPSALGHLVLAPEVRNLLWQLRDRFELYLLTSGASAFQQNKIAQLELDDHFSEIFVVNDSSSMGKIKELEKLIDKRRFNKESVLIVGNRLDNEIAAGNALGLPTVWVKQGEGCELKPGTNTGQPDFMVRSVLELGALLRV